MKILRVGLIKGIFRHARIIPKLVIQVHGWPSLLADCMGWQKHPYQLKTRNGIICELRPGTSDWWIFLEIFVFEIYLRAQGEAIRSQVIIDIGANVGYFALYCLSLNPRAQIHAFEPFSGNSAQFEKNLLLNKDHHISLHAAAVADKPGEMTLFYTPGDDSGCSLNRQQAKSCQVTAVGINNLLDVCKVPKCDLLKMDCEGSELDLLSAMLPDESAKIGSIIMEYHDPAQLTSLEDILVRAGFECEVLPKINTLFAVRK